MTEFIILTRDEAEKLRGVTSLGHALDPIEIKDGTTFILPMEVLADPAHARVIDERKADKEAPIDLTDSRKKREVLEVEFKREVLVEGEAKTNPLTPSK